MDKIACEDSIGVIILDCGLTKDKSTSTAEEMMDLLGEKSVLFWGNEQEIKIGVSQDFFNTYTSADLLKKPADLAELRDKMSKCIQRFKQDEFEQSIVTLERSELVATKIKNFFLYNTLPYDAYLEISETKFAKYISKDVPYNASLIEDLIKRKVKHLHLRKDDQLKMLESALGLLSKFFVEAQSKEIEIVLQKQVLAVSLIHQYVAVIGITESIIKLTHEVIRTASECFFKLKNLNDFLARFPYKTRDSAEQSVMTIYVCIFILAKMGWNSQTSREKMALASILHDCALTNDDMTKIYSLKDPNLKMFTQKEQEDFPLHPLRAAEISKHFSGFSEVAFVIEQHHELPTQDGFPKGLNSHEITTYSGVFILSNNFVSLINQRGTSQESLKKSLQLMTKDYTIGNFKTPFLLLEKMIKE